MAYFRGNKKLINKVLSLLLLVSTLCSSLPISIAKAQETTSPQAEPIQVLPPIDPEILDKPLATVQTPLPESAKLKPKARVYQLSKKAFSSSEKISLVMDQIEPTEVTAKLTDFAGKERKVFINEFKKADYTILEINPSSSITPGKYTLTVTTQDGQTSSQDFSWGVLALNTNKSVYYPGEMADLAMAVLDDRGEMVCDAQVSLKITDPEMAVTTLSTETGEIITNPECKVKDFTLKPDYEAHYLVAGVGVYSTELTAVTENGAQTITDSFEARVDQPLDVERQTATRIYPPLPYPVKFNITANQDFKGKVTEVVPASFEVSENSNVQTFTSVETIPEKQIQTEAVLGANLNLNPPFKGSHPITTMFGELESDPLMQKKYEQYGLIGHDGVDFALPEETALYSVDDGVVVKATALGDYGTTIVVEHSWGKSYYGHLSKLLAPEGKEVEKGSLLGLSGNTGLSTGPHLHFGVKMNQNDSQNGYYGKTDPLPLLGIEPTSSVLGIQAPVNSNVKVLTWELDLKKGESVTLGYKFKAPDISPQFYTLGPLTFEDENAKPIFKEARSWQVAADAVVVTGGIVGSEAQFGGNQRKVAFVNSAWYAFYNDGANVSYSKSADGSTWDTPVALTSDNDNYNPSVDVSGNFILVAWVDNGTEDAIEIRTIDTGSADALTGVCTGPDEGSIDTNNFLVSIAALTTTTAVVAFSDTTDGDSEVNLYEASALTGGSCTPTYTDVHPGNIQFGSQNSGVTAGDRPVLVGISSTTVMMIFQNSTTLKSARYDATLDEWRRNNQSIAASDTNTLYSATTDGTNTWVLSASSTATNLYHHPKASTGINETATAIDADIGASGDEQSTEIDIWCPPADATNCKIVYIDNLESASPDLIFVDCNSADCNPATATFTTLDTDTGSATIAPSPALFCVASDDCKIMYTDILAAPDLTFIDCTADEDCSDNVQTDINTDLGTSASNGSPAIYCVATDNCKFTFFEDDLDDLYFGDCGDATCSGTAQSTGCTATPRTCTAIALNINTTNVNVKSSIYCLSDTDCKVVFHDAVNSDLTFIDCSAAACTTQDTGSPFDIDGTVGGTDVNVPNAIDCVGGSTDCKVIYADANDTDFYFVDCGTGPCDSGNTITTIDATAGGLVTHGVDLDCVTATDCKGTFVGNTAGGSEDQYFFDCDDATCTSGSVVNLDDPPTRAALSCPTTADCKLIYYDAYVSDTDVAVRFADCTNEDCLPEWESLTAPWTSETNVLSVSLTYDSSNTDLIANIIKDASETAYYSISDATTISWAAAVAYDGFTAAGDMDNLSSPETAAGTSEMGVLLRQGSNIEFDLLAVAGPTLAETLRHGGWFSGGTEQPFTF